MVHSVQLSILLTTHTDQRRFGQLLEEVLELHSPQIEVIIVNDAADSFTTHFIQNAIGKSPNSRVFLFEHEQPAGRGLSLNEAIIQASGTYIWAPLQADNLQENQLINSLEYFTAEPAAFCTLGPDLPQEMKVEEWLSAAEKGDLPDDSCLLWNRDLIPVSSLYFNPFLTSGHGAELAFRLCRKYEYHQAEAFFSISKDRDQQLSGTDFREFLYASFRNHQTEEERRFILERLQNLKVEKTDHTEELSQARQFYNEGDHQRALETIGLFLEKYPDHPEANEIKAAAAEKLQQGESEHKNPAKNLSAGALTQAELFIEAQKNGGSEAEKPAGEPLLSVVIPTAGVGKQPLETTLLHLEKAVDPATTELIIVDNASIDDTFDYLEQLQKEEFLQISVLIQKTNKGFGASVNKGIEASKGEYILVLHNDVSIQPNCVEELKQAINQTKNSALAAPVVEPVDIAAQQKNQSITDSFVLTDIADSCCFMIPQDLQIRFDEQFQLCHFEMEDFCLQITNSNREIVVARNTVAEHRSGATTGAMGIRLSPQLKWKNREYFNNKWTAASGYEIPAQGSHPQRFEMLGPPDNPANPDEGWLQAVREYLTNEVKTEILRGSWSEEELIVIVSTLLIADERELLRTLEDRLDELDIAPPLLVLFVHYYFNKNIYSRCRHYLKKAGNSHPVFDLYRLKILIADKELEEASPLLNKMLKKYPASAELFQLAGDIYRQTGDEEEAASFYSIANQLDPYRFENNGSAFEIKF